MVGTTVSQYEILAELGAGGMGTVYKARDTRLDRIVALKFISGAGAGSDDDCEKLLREARVTAAINHPNVCAVLDIQQSPEANFLVMEYVDGRSLRAEIEAGPMEASKALGIALQAVEGLRAAHRQGFIHRDVKPENILLDAEGRVKVTDFGLARRADAHLAEDGLSGTISYMSPEQLRGETLDLSTDVWSMGVVLYEMLAGRRPFEGVYRQAVMYSIANERQKPIAETIRSAAASSPAGTARAASPPPTVLERVVNRCLEKIPAVRYQDAEALLAELKEAKRALKDPDRGVARAIAVLPFEDLSSAGDNRYFSDGLTEEITANLSGVKGVRVVSRTTAARYDRTGKNAAQIASDLGVQYLLEGSVRKRADDVLITTRLVDARSDAQLWSEKYPGTMDDVFSIQETVAGKIAKALRLKLTAVERKKLGKRPTASAEAYQLYLKGRYMWNRREREALNAAIRYFERAIRKDRKYALAWAGLADAYNFLSEFGGVERAETYAKARDAVNRALELDGQLAEARTSLGSLLMLYERDWAAAEREYRLSLYLKPQYATTHHWLAELLLFTGRPAEAVMEIDKANELEPLSPAIARDRGIILYYMKRFDEAVAEGRRALELDRSFVPSHRLVSLAHLGRGDASAAIEENRLWGELSGNKTEAALWLAYIRVVSGDPDGARAIVAGIPPDELEGGFRLRARALVHTGLGENDLAIECLRRAIEVRSEAVTSIGIDFKFDPLRADERFQELLRKMGLMGFVGLGGPAR